MAPVRAGMAGGPSGTERTFGARAGRAIEPRNLNERGADAVQEVEGNIAGGARREQPGTPRSENQGMRGTFMHENRVSPCPPVRLISGRAAQGTPRR
jgi:hypothetical protein